MATCNLGKVKHKTSAGQRSPSLIIYGPVLVFNRALVIFQHFCWGQSFCSNSFLCHCCSFSPSMSFATISFVITLLFWALFGLCNRIIRYRGYYMATRRYEISLWVLKNISRVSAANEWNIFNTRREISYLQAAIKCSINFYYMNTNEIPNHFTETVFSSARCDLLCGHINGDIFTCENNVLFSRVKISCFGAKAHLVFHWCLYNKVKIS